MNPQPWRRGKLGDPTEHYDASWYAAVYSRSIPKQIEYWSRIGKIAEEDPDLPYSFIQEILLAQQEEAEPFNFSQE